MQELGFRTLSRGVPRAILTGRSYHKAMKRTVYFIRHAIAEDREVYRGHDLDRPLTTRGKRKAQAIFARLAERRSAPNVVITSAAKRAVQTAELFCKAFGLAAPKIDPALNPGASPSTFRRLMDKLPAEAGCVALIGHEPDFSLAISELTSNGTLDLRLKKCGIVEIEWSPGSGGLLTMSLPPDILSR